MQVFEYVERTLLEELERQGELSLREKALNERCFV